ncbi:hypothetical protein [Streptomyces sp. NPDC102437]|uniref:hypothetical protein n=1 Tax=Streptomyces sp. NPDC102437 TaxID=3366175 RepID=UPI0037F2F4AF
MLFLPEDHETHSRTHVAQLRAALAARPGDARPAARVREAVPTIAGSPGFRRGVVGGRS